MSISFFWQSKNRQRLFDEENVDFPSVTVEGSNSFPCENWNNVCRIKMSLMHHYTVFHDITVNLQAVTTITYKNRLKT